MFSNMFSTAFSSDFSIATNNAATAFLKRTGAAVFGVALLLAVAPACSPAGALCEREKECASDPPGEDFIRVCTISVDGSYNALNANDEEDCKILASARIAYDACRAALDCDDYREADLGGNCDDESDALSDALGDAGGDCSALD